MSTYTFVCRPCALCAMQCIVSRYHLSCFSTGNSDDDNDDDDRYMFMLWHAFDIVAHCSVAMFDQCFSACCYDVLALLLHLKKK